MIKLLCLSAVLFASGLSVAATLQPEMVTVLNELQSLNPKPIELLTPAEARLQPGVPDAIRSILAKEHRVPDDTGLERVYNITIAGLPARVYKPFGHASLPVTLYFHGGGWVLADLDSYESSAFGLAKRSGSIVVSVEYRKAPEHKFPAAHDDAFAAYKWLVDQAPTIGGDPKRIAVAGESAGGNLALNVAIRARDTGMAIPVHVLSIYPVAGNDLNKTSYTQNAKAHPLDKPMMVWFFKQYLNSTKESEDPRINLVSPSLTLKGLPPTTIIAAEIDPLMSEGALLSSRLKAAGVPVTYRLFPGTTHEFFGAADVLKAAVDAQTFAAQELRRAF